MVYFMENPVKNRWFGGTMIFGNTHLYFKVERMEPKAMTFSKFGIFFSADFIVLSPHMIPKIDLHSFCTRVGPPKPAPRWDLDETSPY